MSIQCSICGYIVTEPVCTSCALKEIRSWIRGQDIKKQIIKTINKELRSLLIDLDSLDFEIVSSPVNQDPSIKKCILCKEEMPPVCYYCVIDQSYTIMEKYVRSRFTLENFKESFNIGLYDENLNKSVQPTHN